MKIFIQNNPLYYNCIKYTLGIFAHNKKINVEFVDNASAADLKIDETPNTDLPIAIGFYKGLKENKFQYSNYLEKICLITTNSQPDLLATCFYMLNSLQEYNATDYDEVGRFVFEKSYQYKFENIKENLVQKYFDKLAQHPKFLRTENNNEKSSVFISHDIDNVNLAWIEDGFAALKAGQIHHVFRLLFNAAIQKPDWFNMDKIMTIHDEYGLKSTFFWVANKGKSANGLYNADYDVRSKKVQQTISSVQQKGFENGIHKSVSDENFEQEAHKLGFKPIANRYHYLKFSLPQAYNELELAHIKLDASLGFAKSYGFRNSYGQAFQPFNFKKQKAYNFVEIPLNIMDRTFHYTHTPIKSISNEVISFFEANKFNCTLSLLWHNNFFNSIKYKGYLQEYKKIIAYLYENDFKSLTQQEIISKYLIFGD
ncbi:MAG TPA: hypothetical protein VNX01_02410 [Bacteroidia bacterium]|nr:hypothetical protein [Bacteroidia bacterium]